jgi:CHAD domain-containing protein
VHDLRTRARRIEAIAGMLLSNQENSKRRLLKVLKPLRKAAGEVRDMDVLSAKARTLARHCRNDSAARLLAHLQTMRIESAHKLVDVIVERRPEASHSLRQFSIEIEKRVQRQKNGSAHNTSARKPHTDAAIRLMNDLSDWPPFSAANLHAFRIKVKELRYILQLTDAADPKFVATLERAKARIGDWHDWQEFRKIAGEVLHERKDRTLLEEMEQTENKKLKQALAAAQTLRTRYLGAYRGFTIAEP